jgi:hypothetical protein
VSRRSRFEALLPTLLACAIAGASARADVVKGPEPCLPGGRIASLSGSAISAGARGTRALACGDELCTGDIVTTGPGASIGILSGGMLTQLGADSRARVWLTADQTPAVDLERGGVRIVDPRDGGPPGRLTVLKTLAEISGNDTEAHVVEDAAGRAARFCEWDAPLRVDGQTLAPGSCLTVRSGAAPTIAAAGGGATIAALVASCDPTPTIPALANLVPLPPVAGPPENAPPLPGPLAGPLRSACDVPGSGCSPAASVVEQPPSTGPFPGGRN